jgi:hypothetical protein
VIKMIDIKKINKRTLFLLILLMITLIGLVFNKKIYKPNKSKINKLKYDIIRISEEIQISQTEIPNLEEARRKLETNKQALGELNKSYEAHKEGIPMESEIGTFLGYLTMQEQENKLDFVSIKPIDFREEGTAAGEAKAEKTKKPYLEKEFAIKVHGSLESILDYIYYIQGISSTSSISKMSVILMEDRGEKYLQGNINLRVLFALASDRENKARFRPLMKEKIDLAFKSNPFFAQQMMEKAEVKEDAKEDITIIVEGVISMGKDSRIIYNKNIYKIGDSINGFEILDISPDRVVLKGNKGDIIINVKGK